jgi:metallo-beta-lactamase class B
LFASLASLVIATFQPAAATDGAALARACEGHNGWSDPAPPARIWGNTYYVGTCGISAILVAGTGGHILIDGTTAEAAPQVAANIARLGFRIRDVRLILSSHEHADHAGGIAELQRLSGATVAARAPAIPALSTGRSQAGDPQHGSLGPLPAMRVGRTIRNGEIVRLGNLRLTAHATPGHTPGSTSWSWTSCRGRQCARIVYADSVSAVSADLYRFSDHPSYVADFRRSLARIGALPCTLLLTPHPEASDLSQRLAAGRVTDPAACRVYAARGSARLDERLRREAAR